MLNIKQLLDIAKGGKEWLSLLLSLLLALFIWFVHNMSLEYSSYLKYSIEIKTNIEGRALSSKSQDMIILRGKTTGFYILEHSSISKANLSITLDAKYLHQSPTSEDVFIVYCEEIKDKIVEAIGNDVSLEFFSSESIPFVLPKMENKKVPVIAKTAISFKGQYMPISEIILRPDSVVIYGEEQYTSNIEAVYTRTITLRQVDKSIQGIAKLNPVRHAKLSQNQVFYSFETDRYVEKSITVPISTENVPDDKELIVIPSHLQLTFRQPFHAKRRFSAKDFKYSVDYYDFIESIDSKVVPIARLFPSEIYSIEISPSFVECIYIDN